MRLIDTHCHIDVEEFADDRAVVIANARAAGVALMVVPAVSAAAWAAQQTVIDAYAGVVAAYGLHPCYMAQHADQDIEALGDWLEQTQAVAVGEIGLDFFIEDADPEAQIRLFEAQLGIAQSLSLPVILHARKSHDLLLKSLRKFRLPGGVVHAYSGSEQQAHALVDAGFVLGFGGGATYERAHKLHRLLRDTPLEAVVLETDAPDIPPAFARGERNSPVHLPTIASCLASIRGVTMEHLAEATTATASRLFRLTV